MGQAEFFVGVIIFFSNSYIYDQILGARDGDSSNTKVNKVNLIIYNIIYNSSVNMFGIS